MKREVKNIIRESELSLHEIARRSDVPLTTISGWVNTDRDPYLSKAEKVLRALGYKLLIVPITEEEC